MQKLIVRHVGSSGAPQFVVTRGADNRDADVVTLASPVGFKVPGSAGRELMGELAWYLEKFLDYPFPPRTDQAERARQALGLWGRQAFDALFGVGRARDFYRDAVQGGLEGLCVEVRSDDPRVLAWPWEALEDTESSLLALGCQIERRLSKLADPLPLSEKLPPDRVNILLVIARPYEGDVAYRSIARPLVETIQTKGVAAEVTVLRPPTFARLQEVLTASPGEFHILHFDGHGGYGLQAPQLHAPDVFRGALGRLVFETEEGEPDPIDSDKLSALLREYRLPVVVLNACQSGMVDQHAEDAFASVAAALLKGGVRSVVAMAYSLYVSGAKQFLPAFYRGLFERGDVGEAARAGRKKMYERPGRVCAVGTYDLADWLVPVVYQQEKLGLTLVQATKSVADVTAVDLPEAARDSSNPYGFIGRDRALLELERALHRKPAGILIQGLGGVGKTTLARGFLKWLSETGGLDHGAIWLTFNEVHSAEFVVNQLTLPLFGANALAASLDEKVQAVTRALRDTPLVIVWDNFESACGTEGAAGLLAPADLECLKQMLEQLRGGKTKVLITSRSGEDWLGSANRYKLPLGGLQGEERWEFCKQILADLGRSADHDDPDLVDLMEALGGHPLLMRAVLPRLESMSAAAILAAVQGNLAAIDAGGDPLHAQVVATLRFVESSLPEPVRPLLVPLSLHERFAHAEDLKAMANAVPGDWTPHLIEQLMASLCVAGLVTSRGGGIHELHPALTGFLRMQSGADPLSEHWERAFSNRLAQVASHIGTKGSREERTTFFIHEANFRNARLHAQRLATADAFSALTETLGMHAIDSRAFTEAIRLYKDLAIHEQRVGNRIGLATCYHQLGIVCQQQHDLDAAEAWYQQSLSIEESHGNERRIAISHHHLGRVAEERRDFDTAEKLYLRSVAVFEKHDSYSVNAAPSYHQLGRVAQERRDFLAAEQWYLKSLAIDEKQNNEDGKALAYHQLGIVAQEREDFEAAEKWFLKSLAIEESHTNDRGIAFSCGQLGNLALKRRDFEAAEKLYLKAIAICERQRDDHGTALGYHQLGVVAHQQGDLEAAKDWYLKSAEVKRRRGDLHGIAISHHQLGKLAAEQREFDAAGEHFIRSAESLLQHNDEHRAAVAARSFLRLLQQAPAELEAQLLERWRQAGLPEPQSSSE